MQVIKITMSTDQYNIPKFIIIIFIKVIIHTTW